MSDVYSQSAGFLIWLILYLLSVFSWLISIPHSPLAAACWTAAVGGVRSITGIRHALGWF
jgi:hypothetical protein